MRWYHVSYHYQCAGGSVRESWQRVRASSPEGAIHIAGRNHSTMLRTTATAVECEAPMLRTIAAQPDDSDLPHHGGH